VDEDDDESEEMRRKETQEARTIRKNAENWFRREYDKYERRYSGSRKGEKMAKVTDRMREFLEYLWAGHFLNKGELSEVTRVMRDLTLDVIVRQMAYLILIGHSRSYRLPTRELELECFNLIPIGFLSALPLEVLRESPNFYLQTLQQTLSILASGFCDFSYLDSKPLFRNFRTATRKIGPLMHAESYEQLKKSLNDVHEKFVNGNSFAHGH